MLLEAVGLLIRVSVAMVNQAVTAHLVLLHFELVDQAAELVAPEHLAQVTSMVDLALGMAADMVVTVEVIKAAVAAARLGMLGQAVMVVGTTAETLVAQQGLAVAVAVVVALTIVTTTLTPAMVAELEF